MKSLAAVAFAFAPDSRRLAVFGYGVENPGTGLYILDVILNQYQLVASLNEARSLQWSPDGEYLALVGVPPGASDEEVLVYHLRTRLAVVEQNLAGVSSETLPEWLASLWGKDFPAQMGGMDACAFH
jgi:Tol biopolymer transport system component